MMTTLDNKEDTSDSEEDTTDSEEDTTDSNSSDDGDNSSTSSSDSFSVEVVFKYTQFSPRLEGSTKCSTTRRRRSTSRCLGLLKRQLSLTQW